MANFIEVEVANREHGDAEYTAILNLDHIVYVSSSGPEEEEGRVYVRMAATCCDNVKETYPLWLAEESGKRLWTALVGSPSPGGATPRKEFTYNQ